MAIRIRRLVVWPLALMLVAAAAAPTMAGVPEDGEPLVFELTLSGPVDPNDSFAIEHTCRTTGECAFIESVTPICSSDERQQEDWGTPPCEARTYRLETEREAGVTVEYGLLRAAGSPAREASHLLSGSVTVPKGGITLSLGYNYSLPATLAPTLPDTATAGPSQPIPAAQAGTATAEVVFRLTLEGPVPADHTFAILCGVGDNPCFGPDQIEGACSPNETGLPTCEATTYDLVAHAAVGETLEYTLLRWTTPDLAHTDDQPEELLPGSWTVQEGRQVISLGFDYSLTGQELLPDTAMRAP